MCAHQKKKQTAQKKKNIPLRVKRDQRKIEEIEPHLDRSRHRASTDLDTTPRQISTPPQVDSRNSDDHEPSILQSKNTFERVSRKIMSRGKVSLCPS
jgi:hypothetical protein